MRRTHLFNAALLTVMLTACSNSDVWDDVPAKIATFLNRYYPNSQLASCNRNGGGWYVRIEDGPGLAFDHAYDWTMINGYGEIIPQMLLFDQLPPTLYQYLEETDVLNHVYALERDRKQYHVDITNTRITYDIATGKTQSPIPPD